MAVAHPDAARLAATADHYGIIETYTDHHELLASADLDGVVISVPHAYHYEIARAALDAWLHVLVEKPHGVDGGARPRSGRHCRLRQSSLDGWHHVPVHAPGSPRRNLVQSGKIGTVLFVSGLFASIVESYYRGRPDDYESVFQYPVHGPVKDTYSDPNISGGGQGQTQLSHGMGMVFWVTGLRAVEVLALMEKRDLAVDLVDAISYRFDNGAVGTMRAAGSLVPGQPQQQEFRYYGTEGFILQDLVRGKLSVHYNDGTAEDFPTSTRTKSIRRMFPAEPLPISFSAAERTLLHDGPQQPRSNSLGPHTVRPNKAVPCGLTRSD